jgi:N-acyl homoserine lactone hydrolase
MARLHLIVDGIFEADRRIFLPEGPRSTYSAAAKSLLIESGREKILVDTGIGTVPDDRKFDAIRRVQKISRSKTQGIKVGLARLGIQPDQITAVVNTHLHSAHSGGNNLFANAHFYISRSEFRFIDRSIGEDPNQTAYITENYERLKSVNEMNGEYQITDEVRVMATPGHTTGHQSVVVSNGRKKLVYSGDVAPLRENLTGHVAMTGCDREAAIDSMDRLLEIGNAEWIFSHDKRQLSLSKAYSPKL